jgi:hypothetical protein
MSSFTPIVGVTPKRREFKDAFDTTDEMDAYSRVQAVERAVSRVLGLPVVVS